MLDFNQSLDPAEASRRIARLAPYDLHWIEEPVPQENLQGHATVRATSPIPIQAGENWWFPRGFAEAIAVGASDFIMPDLMKVGGVTGWLRVAGASRGRIDSDVEPSVRRSEFASAGRHADGALARISRSRARRAGRTGPDRRRHRHGARSRPRAIMGRGGGAQVLASREAYFSIAPLAHVAGAGSSPGWSAAQSGVTHPGEMVPDFALLHPGYAGFFDCPTRPCSWGSVVARMERSAIRGYASGRHGPGFRSAPSGATLDFSIAPLAHVAGGSVVARMERSAIRGYASGRHGPGFRSASSGLRWIFHCPTRPCSWGSVVARMERSAIRGYASGRHGPGFRSAPSGLRWIFRLPHSPM